MLVSFSVENFRSFGAEATLNLVASNKFTDHASHLVAIPETGKSVLRTALIYGANAAGKSNLVSAMSTAQRMIVDDSFPRFRIEPFRFDQRAPQTPTTFEFRFLANDRVFVYGFDVLKGTGISGEWLSHINGSDERLLFERFADGTAILGHKLERQFPDDPQLEPVLANLVGLPLKPEQLLLNRALTVPKSALGKTLVDVIQWLTVDLVILPPDHRARDILDLMEANDQFRQFASEFLQQVGTGIQGLDLVTEERSSREWERDTWGDGSHISYDSDFRPSAGDSTRVVSRQLLARHSSPSGSDVLKFSEESDGTQQLLHLMPYLAAGADQRQVVVIDELDRSLHPLICWEFIRFFTESFPGAHRQLIVTTHDVHLLNQDLLRRDEYWFVEKEADQQSRLFALSEFNIRNDLKVEKGYLQGRFGAIPVIGGMDDLEKSLNCATKRGRQHATQEKVT